jgi:hypothetical protein
MATQVKRLDLAIVVLRKLSDSNGIGASKRRTMSAAARRKISVAQRARWARWKAKQANKAA